MTTALRPPTRYDDDGYALINMPVDQPQMSPGNHEELQQSVLHQTPAPREYISHNLSDMNHGVDSTEPGGTNPDNNEVFDPASLLPYEDESSSSSSQSTGSAAHINGTTEEPRQTSSDDYQGLDPSVLETLRQSPTPSVYASLSPNVPVMSQEVDNTEADGANPDGDTGEPRNASQRLDPSIIEILRQPPAPYECASLSLSRPEM